MLAQAAVHAPHVASKTNPFEVIKTDRLFVLYDAGETNAMIPVMKRLEAEGKDFKVLVMGTSETIVKPGMFEGKRLVLKDLEVSDIVDKDNWKRDQEMSGDGILKIRDRIIPKAVIVGTASSVQRQVLPLFKAASIAFCDNFDYDMTHESFKTVDKVQAVASKVLCPSKNLVKLLSGPQPTAESLKKYEIAGKPTLEQWKKDIEAVDQADVLRTLGFDKSKGPVITFVGGYGEGYEFIHILFEATAKCLRQRGYQVLIQPHPKVAQQKVKTPEALAVSDYVIGFNSSVIFDSAVIGKKAIFFYPNLLNFSHFAIREGYIPKVSSFVELLQTIEKMKNQPPVDLYEKEQIPKNSTDRILEIIENALKTGNQ